jgi:putative PEP-CTERM system TPR-repeat lipoprotein
VTNQRRSSFPGSKYAFLLPLALLALLSVLYGCSKPPELVNRLETARRHVANGELDQAVFQYKAAISENPERGDVRIALARLYIEGGAGAFAEKEIRHAIQSGYTDDSVPVLLTTAFLQAGKNQDVADGEPFELAGIDLDSLDVPPGVLAELHALRGHAYWALRQFDESAASYDRSLAIDPDFHEALAGKALIALSDDDQVGAREFLNRAITNEAESVVAWRNLGALEQYQENLPAAEIAFGHAIDAELNNAKALFSRFLVRLRLKNLDGAKADLAQYEQVSSSKLLVAYGNGLVAFHEKRYEQAIDGFNDALRIVPDYVPALAYAGFSNFILKRDETARSQLEAVNSMRPESMEVKRALALVYLRLGDARLARGLAEQIVAARPNDPDGLNILSTAALARGDRDVGIAALKRAAADQPEAPRSRARFGMSLLSDGQFDEGFAELKTASEQAPDQALTHGVLVFGYMQRGDFAQATAAAERARDAIPDNPIGNNLIGGIKLAQQDLEGAKDAFKAALEIVPGEPSASNNLASIAKVEGDLAAAREIYQNVLKYFPAHMHTHLKLVELNLDAGDTVAARHQLDAALKVKPDDPSVLFSLALIQNANNESGDAIVTLDKLYSLAPGNMKAARLRAEIYLNGNDPQRAIEVLDRAIKIEPNSAHLYSLLGKAHANSGDLAAAENAYTSVLRTVDTQSIGLQIDTIRWLTELGRLDIATQALARFTELRGDTIPSKILAGMIALKQGETAEARDIFAAVIAEKPDSREPNLLIARAQGRLGNNAAAAKQLENWLERQPSDTQARYQLGNIYSSMYKDGEKSIDMYQQVIAAEPNHVLALNNLAWLLRESDLSAALQYARRAAEIQPKSAAILDTLGTLQASAGEIESALSTLRRAVGIAPKSNEIKLNLGRTQIQAGDVDAARRSLSEIVDSGETSSHVATARELLARIRN